LSGGLVRDVRAATNAEWDAAWRSSPTATFYESRHWAEAWRVATRGRLRPEATVVELGDGSTVVVPQSLDFRLAGWFRLRRMSAGDTYGSWLSPRILGQADGRELAGLIGTQGESLRWLLNPFLAATLDSSALTASTVSTLAIDLTSGFDQVRARWSKGHKAAPAQARRSGLTVRIAATEADWAAYFRAYRDSLRRWGKTATSRYDWALFRAFSHVDSSLVKLWLAEIEGRVVSGALCFYHPRQIVLWHAATMEQHFPLRPANLLLEEAIRDGSSLEATWFDLGPSGGHEGVERFKLGFGPTRLDVPVVDRATRTVAIIRSVRSAARRRPRPDPHDEGRRGGT